MATVWTADFTFTVDTLNYTADGYYVLEASLWTADADHFTVDDHLYHTADGWHDDVSYNAGGRGSWLIRPDNVASMDRYRQERLQREDEAILAVIEEWLEKAA